MYFEVDVWEGSPNRCVGLLLLCEPDFFLNKCPNV
jgi:hypothetical protein